MKDLSNTTESKQNTSQGHIVATEELLKPVNCFSTYTKQYTNMTKGNKDKL